MGEVCLEIVAAYLEVYRDYMPSIRSKKQYYAYRFVPRLNQAIGQSVSDERKKQIEKWWKARKDKSLLALQIEAFSWAIEKRELDRNVLRIGRPGETPAEKEVRQLEESAVADELEKLVAVRGKLEKDGKLLHHKYDDDVPPPAQGSRE